MVGQKWLWTTVISYSLFILVGLRRRDWWMSPIHLYVHVTREAFHNSVLSSRLAALRHKPRNAVVVLVAAVGLYSLVSFELRSFGVTLVILSHLCSSSTDNPLISPLLTAANQVCAVASSCKREVPSLSKLAVHLRENPHGNRLAVKHEVSEVSVDENTH